MSKQKFHPSFYIGICSFIMFIFLTISVATHQQFINIFDQKIINIIANNNYYNLLIAKRLTVIGNTSTILIATILLLLYLLIIKQYYLSLFMFLTMSLANSSNWLIKHLIKRSRPTVHHLIYAGGYSYPSGHSLGSITLFGILLIAVLLLIKNKPLKIIFCSIFILLPLIIGYTRIYLHVHFPTDVLGGWLEGLSFILIIYSIFQYFNLLKKGYHN